MACAKPPDPASMTPPENPRHPSEPHPTQILRELTAAAIYAQPGTTLDDLLSRAEDIVDRARREHASGEEMRRLDNQLEGLRAQARQIGRTALDVNFGLFGDRHTTATAANVAAVQRAMKDNSNWAAKEMRADLLKLVENSGNIPTAYKSQLHKDLAVVLEACPHAGGLVNELTLRGQRGASGSASKLGSKGNAGVGYAYELMGTAALTTKVSSPSNVGAPALFIQSGKDIVTFGDKSYLNGRANDHKSWQRPSRSTVECDIRIGRSTLLDGYREIGIDFKHRAEMGTTYSSKDLANQVKAVAEVIKDGQLHEFHFVTNGTFGGGFPKEIAKANEELVGLGLTPIGIHEHVHTLSADPSAVSP